MVRHKVTRLRVLWLALLLAFALCPVRAYADTTPTEFFEDLAGAVGVTLDLASEVWQDKTVGAYCGFIDERLRNVTTPLDFYGYGQAIQDLTGYDVVAYQDGRYYMKSCPDASGGAMYDIDCSDVSNMAALLQETMKWVRYSAENGPEWPNGGSSSGGVNSGTTEVEFASPVVVYGIVGHRRTGTNEFVSLEGYQESLSIYYAGRISSKMQSMGHKYWVIIGSIGANVNETPVYRLYTSADPITYECTVITSYSNYSYYKTTITHSSNVSIWNINSDYPSSSLSGSGASDINSYVIGILSSGPMGGDGGQSGGEDDTPPKEPDPDHDPITWPDITIGNLPSFSPTINITNNATYDQTTGEIDLTPITERLDAINANLEYFYQSFNELRSDFLHYMNLIGDALETIETDIWNCETQLRLAVKWLQNIFYKQGGTGSSKPDIGTNNNGFWDWLREVLTNLLGQLPQSLSEMLDIFEDLSGYFPFCVPWDLYALLAMFAADPQTPIFDLPMPVPDVVNHAKYLNIHLDFSGYNIVAQQVRKIELIMFSAWLTLTTPKLLQGITNVGKVKG